MSANIERRLSAFNSPEQKRSLEFLLQSAIDGSVTQTLTAAGLVISAAAATTAKTGLADSYAIVDGALVKTAASTILPVLTGLNISAGKYNVFVFFVDGSGVLTVAMGLEGATIGAVQFPAFPSGKACVGFLLVTSAGVFTGGTTALDAATTLYFSPTGDFNPTYNSVL